MSAQVLLDMIEVRQQFANQLADEIADYKTALRVAYPEEYEKAFGADSITCPQCGRTSHNPNDVREKYCGYCHQYHDTMDLRKG